MTDSVCECPLCQATFQATPEMAGAAVQCPGCAKLLQLPDRIGSHLPQVCQAIRIDVCECPQCRQGFGYTTQMLGTLVACPHCGSSFQLSATGRLGKEVSGVVSEKSVTSRPKFAPAAAPPSPPPPPKPAQAKRKRFRDSDSDLPDAPEKPAPQTGSLAQQPTEPPRIETAGSRRKEVAEADFRIDLAKPLEQLARGAQGKTGGPTNVAPSTSKNETAKPNPASPSVGPQAKAARAQLPQERNSEAIKATLSPVEAADSIQQQGLPPSFSSRAEDRNSRPNVKLGQAASEAAQLLPPRYYSSDPTIIRQAKSRAESAFVLLPDASGGFQRVNNTVMRIQHEGETIVLAAADPAKVRRRRWIVNLLTLVVCLGILYLTFRWLLD
ncbi:MAG: hypothetical protein ACK493_09305 [Planctomycetota bacterium]|jgi:hypothetical protein|nr:hypothetical protein [Blastopirellula sp.]